MGFDKKRDRSLIVKVILAIDGGGSRTRCFAIDRDGRILGAGESGPSNHLLVDHDIVKRSLKEAIERSLVDGGLSRAAVVSISAGLAGVDYQGAGRLEMESVLREFGFESLVVEGDLVIAHAGALNDRPGVVVLAGTGSATLGVGSNGKRVKVGGWGPIFGDEGSAQRIGRMALRAAARNFDGRGPATELTDALLRTLGLSDFQDTIARVYQDNMKARDIAGLSRVAYEVAEAGDEVARGIFRTAGEELAETAEAAIRQLNLAETDVLVSYQGSVLEHCSLVRNRFAEVLRRDVQGALITAPRFPPVIGAYLRGRTALGWGSSAETLEQLEVWTRLRVE